MNRETGGAIGDLDLISQSITDILTTRIGTRVMRREYGSLLPELVDHPFNDATRLRVYAAAVRIRGQIYFLSNARHCPSEGRLADAEGYVRRGSSPSVPDLSHMAIFRTPETTNPRFS